MPGADLQLRRNHRPVRDAGDNQLVLGTQDAPPSIGSFVDLAAGNYYLEIRCLFCDPQFATQIFTLDGALVVGTQFQAAAAVPEPALAVLFGVGIAGLGLVRRRYAFPAGAVRS